MQMGLRTAGGVAMVGAATILNGGIIIGKGSYQGGVAEKGRVIVLGPNENVVA